MSSLPEGDARGDSPNEAGSPLVHELPRGLAVSAALEALCGWPKLLLLESVLERPGVGRYSYLMADPYAIFQTERVRFSMDPFAELRLAVSACRSEAVAGLPRFQGGAAGLISYEAGRAFERFPPRKRDEFELPDLAVGLYDWVIAWDHEADRCWIVSHGWPVQDAGERAARAEKRLQRVLAALNGQEERSGQRGGPAVAAGFEAARLPVESLVEQFPAPGLDGLTSDFSREGYLRAVARVIEYIRAGDIFQANLSQRLLAPLTISPRELYQRLCERNPATFAGFLEWDDWALASASPERFVCVDRGEVETRPIKGTRRRRFPSEADLYTGDELRSSEKDRSENVMIVDLLRNDLSRVCEPGSIRVPQLCAVEVYETVQHLVSEVRGQLASAGQTVWDLLAATFPGGSITGAPKIRAIEIINELEPTVRGPYCGSLFAAGYDGSFDSSILIRTMICRRGWAQCPVGGGIVARSEPEREYEETLLKAEGMLRALR